MMSLCDLRTLANYFDRSISCGITSIRDQEELCKPQKPRKLRISELLTKQQEYSQEKSASYLGSWVYRRGDIRKTKH
jgi:hypothetical protein